MAEESCQTVDISCISPHAHESGEIPSYSDSEPDVDRCEAEDHDYQPLDDRSENAANGTLSPPTSSGSCKSHLKLSQAKETFANLPQEESRKLITCPCCSFSTYRTFNLKRHIQRHHANEDLSAKYKALQLKGKCVCLQCDFKSKDISQLRQHLSGVHSVLFKTEVVCLDNYEGNMVHIDI